MRPLQDHITRETGHAFELKLYDEEVLARYTVALWVDRALKHLKLSLDTQVHTVVLDGRSVFEVVSLHSFDVHEVRDVAFLVQEHSFL